MDIHALRDSLLVRVGWKFHARDVSRLSEAVDALGPFSRVTVDFEAARECDDTALVRLAAVLGCVPAGEVTVRGLTPHQWRILTYQHLGSSP